MPVACQLARRGNRCARLACDESKRLIEPEAGSVVAVAPLARWRPGLRGLAEVRRSDGMGVARLAKNASVEDAIINFSLEESRVGAWKSAQNFVALAPPAWPDAIERRDRKIAKVGHIVRHPGVIGTTVNHIIRLGERGGVARKIDILS